MSHFTSLHRAVAAAIVVTAPFASSAALAATSSPVVLKATATGTNVTSDKGSPTGSGSATFTVNESKGTICYSIRSKGLSGIIGVHIHAGAAGVDGQVVVTMNAKRFNATGNTCVKASPIILREIASDPGLYYFNIHTRKFPAGAVRGQLTGTPRVTRTPSMTTPSPKPGY